MKKIPYGRQSITEEDINSVVEALNADFLTQGPRVKAFEDAFAEYTGSKYAIAVSNGTAALHLSTLALNVGSGTKVITSPITFAASSNSVLYTGGEIVFADIDPETLCLDILKVRELLETSPKGTYSGIINIDFAGYPVDMEKFRSLAEEFGLWLIEDACHAPGAYFSDSHDVKNFVGNGSYSDLTVFSFHPVKHIATGEGGMITTNDKELYDKIMMSRTHGITKDKSMLVEDHGGWYYEMQDLGYNYRITDLQSALGISQLGKADTGILKRREIANRYNEAFKESNVTIAKANYCVGHAFHLYVVQVENRKEVYDLLHRQGILVQVHYVPVHLMPYYKNLGWSKGDFPIAESYYSKCLSLPMYPTLSYDDQTFVIDTVLGIIND